MNKFVKISLSLLIVLSMVLNPFSSIFDVKASAVSPEVLMYLEQAGYAFFGMIVTAVGGAVLEEQLEQLDQAFQDRARATYAEIQAPIEQGGSPLVFTSRWSEYEREMMIEQGHITDSQYGVVCSISPSANLTDEQTKFYQAFVDSFNSSGVIAETSYVSGGVPRIKSQDYVNIRNSVTNSFLKQVHDSAVADMVGNGVLPEYDFSFVGPQPSISAPVINGSAPLKKDGFLFSPPIPHTTNKFSTEAEARSYFPFDNVEIYGDDVNGYTVSCYKNLYGMSRYVLYNGKLYFFTERNYVGYQYELGFGHSTAFSQSKSIYYSADGECLADVYKEGSYFSYGFALNETGEVQSGSPTTSFVTDSDFTSQIGGGTVDIPRSEIEDIIGRAMGLGLAVPDSWIQFAQDGSISSVDGIELSKLQELIDAVVAGNVGFENMQEYLDLLTKLVSAGNLTATEQKNSC